MSTAIPPEAIDEGFVPVLRPDVFAVAVDEDTVLLDERGLFLHVLNASATAVAATFGDGRSAEQIAAELSAVYEVSIERVRSDVLTVLRDLGHLGLLEGVTATATQTDPAEE